MLTMLPLAVSRHSRGLVPDVVLDDIVDGQRRAYRFGRLPMETDGTGIYRKKFSSAPVRIERSVVIF
jgi:hypothetical protein